MKQSTIKDKMSAMLQNRRFRRRWMTLLLAMGGVVVLGTAYVLSMPAITLENSAADSYGVGEEPVELGPDAASPSEASGAYMADNVEGSADASLASPSELASPSTPRQRCSVSSYDFSDCALLAEGVWENPAEPESQITYAVYKDPYDRILLDIAGQGATPDMTSTDTPPWEAQFPGSTINAVYVEDGITRLGDFFMKDASAMEEMYLPETLSEMGNHCFELAPSLAELILPSGLESVGERCFYNRKSVMQLSAYLTRKLILPEGLRTIGNDSFNSFPNLETLVLPSSLESIGTGFLPSYLNNVKEFTVPENLSFTYPEQAILFGSFEGVMKLPAQGPEDYWKYFRFAKPSRFEVAPGNEAYRTLDNGRLLCHVEENPEDPANPILRLVGIAKSESGLVEIPEEVSALSNDLLKGRTDIKVLKIQNQAMDYPASSPESNAFGYLSPDFWSSDQRTLLGSLREAYIGGSMIPPYAFYKNSTVETIQLTGEVSELGAQAFNRAVGLKRLVFAHPESVTAIRKGAFNFYSRTTGMEDILRGLNKLTTIEESSFSSVNFAELTIPESVTRLGSDTSSDRAFGQGVRVDTLYYRARDLQTMGYAYSLLSQAPAKMVIGSEVKRIVGAGSSGIASRIAVGVKSVSFEGPNTIEIGTQSGDRGLDLPGSPISSLQTGLKLKGTFIVGADGALYQKQAGSSTVTLVRVPENAGRDSGGSYEVPAAIQDENGVSYTVGGIGNYAFAPAPALRELTIAGDAVSGLVLSDYSFAGNPSLALINGRTSIRELRPLFGVEGRLPDLFKGSGLSVGFVDSGSEVNTPSPKSSGARTAARV